MTKNKKRRRHGSCRLKFEKLEPKRCLASVGWDGPGQGEAELTYYLGDAPAQLGQATFEAVIEQALKVWSDVAAITFTETTVAGRNDSLDITFASIDGSNGILAQAYFPDDVNPRKIAGDIQFDSAENWEVGNTQGSRAMDLLHVAVHEIGHALGLGHSNIFGSVLNSTVSPNQQFSNLSNADIDSILALYAPASTNDPLVPADPVSPAIEPEARGLEEPQVEEPKIEEPKVEVPSTPETPTERDPMDRWWRRWNRFRRFGRNTAGTPDPGAESTDSGSTQNFPNSHRTGFNWRYFHSFR